MSTKLINDLLIQIHHSSPLFWGGKENQRWVYDAARAADLDLAVITDCAPNWLYELVPPSKIAICDLHNDAELYGAASRLAVGNKLRGIVTYAEEFVLATAWLAEKFQLPGVSVPGAQASSADKLQMKRRLKSGNVTSPPFAHVRSAEELYRSSFSLGCPVVVKPRCGGGSVAVRRMDHAYEAERTFMEVSRQAHPSVDSIFQQFDGTFIVEKYVAGPLVSIDGIVTSGQAIVVGMTNTLMGLEPTFYQLGCWTIDIDEECKQLATAAVAALGFEDGAFHCEIRMRPTGPTVIEVAARLPGELIVQMYQEASGADLLKLFIAVSVGDAIQFPSPSKRAVSGAYASFPNQFGRLNGINGIDAVTRHPCVKRVLVSDQVGMIVDIFNPYAVALISARNSAEFHSAFSFVQNKLTLHIIPETK